MRVMRGGVPAMLVNSLHLHGHAFISTSRMGGGGGGGSRNRVILQSSLPGMKNLEPPPNPSTLLTEDQLQENVDKLLDWWKGKQNILCITGAGLSTESGLADYRGHNGSYHQGHKPMIHDQFMNSEYQRKRYWGRGMVGWRSFDSAKPNIGHFALASLERNKRIGVTFEDEPNYYPENSDDWLLSSGLQQMSIITQNVDSLHRRAGSRYVTELHGRTDLLQCMSCGAETSRDSFHSELESMNHGWLEAALKQLDTTEQRPDGDAALRNDDKYEEIIVPPCQNCGNGFLKPTVVFFGDNVPRHRVARCTAAVDAADGILVIGSSLAVYSAFRHVRAAHQKGTPIAILNVGDTRAEIENLNVTKIEAPAGPTLALVAEYFENSNNLQQQQ